MNAPLHAEAFGTLPDGTQVTRATLTAHGMTLGVITYGASVQDLRLEGIAHALVLGFPTLAPYLESGRYFGAIVGRCANRIAGGRAIIDGQPYQLDRNEAGQTTLHGGSNGTGQRNWTVADMAPDRITLIDNLPDGHMGFPGALQVQVTYRILPGPILSITIEATSDRATLANFAQHSFFNLDGRANIAAHRLTVPAQTRLATDAALIPVGAPVPVAGTKYDFRRGPLIGERPMIDDNLCLHHARRPQPGLAATLTAGALTMQITTTEPGLQIYGGAHINTPEPGLMGQPYGNHAGIALEPQIWPDAANHPDYPSALLRPGETYRQITELAFIREAN